MNATQLAKLTILTVLPVFLFAGPIVSQNPRGGKQIPEFKKSAQVFEAGAALDVVLKDFDTNGDVDALILNLGRSLILDNDGDRDIFITDCHQGRTAVWFNPLSERRK